MNYTHNNQLIYVNIPMAKSIVITTNYKRNCWIQSNTFKYYQYS